MTSQKRSKKIIKKKVAKVLRDKKKRLIFAVRFAQKKMKPKRSTAPG